MSSIPGKIPFAPIWLLLRMVKQNGGVSIVRIPMLFTYIMRYALLEPFRLAEIICYHHKVKKHNLTHPPIFILGHWRSGTSFLQGILCQDKKMASSNIYRSLFADCFYLTEPWLKGMLNFICKLFNMSYSIQRTKMNLDYAAEADMALCSLCSDKSYTWGHLFPKQFKYWVDDCILFINEHDGQEWIEHYDYFIKKLSLRAKGKRVVIKSPGDTARVAHLLKKYPQALFMYIHRDPVSVFHSNLYFWKVMLRENSLQNLTDAEIHRLIIRNYKVIVEAYLRQRSGIPPSALIELHYESLLKDPIAQLTRIYDTFNLGQVPLDDINAYLLESRKYIEVIYETDSGLSQRLRKEWSVIFDAIRLDS